LKTFWCILLLLLVSSLWFIAGAVVHNLYPPTVITLPTNTAYLKLGVYLVVVFAYTIGIAIALRYWRD